jgi:hypothetical protein
MQLKRFVLPVLAILLVSTSALAEGVRQQGLGQVTYSSWGNPSAEVKREAVEKAKLSAIQKYTASFSTAQMIDFEKIRATVESDLDRYIPEYRILDDDLDKDAKRYSVVIEALINTSLIEIELQKVSAVQKAPADEKSYLCFVFVAREVKSRKSYDARRTERVVEETSTDEQEEAHVEGDQMGFAGESSKDTRRTTGGSALQKSDEFEYDVSQGGESEINSAMTPVFTTAGFEVVDADYLKDETSGLVDVERFREDFRFGNDISGSTKRDAVQGCRSSGVQYFAIGTLDVGAKDIDPVSGLTRVYVSVNGKIIDLQGRLPKTVASIGPVQYSGLGSDQNVARRNALLLAGENAAKDLTSQLRAKDIK